MPVISLNQATIATLICPDGKSKIEYCDKDLPGLLLHVYPSGGSSYSLRYKSNGQTKYAPIGGSDIVTLADARKKARMLKADIALNDADPRAELKAKRAMPTLTDFFSETYLPYAKAHKRSWKRDVQLFSRIQKQFGHLRLDQIQKQPVAVFHAGLIEEGLSAASADHHPKLLRRMFSMAIDYGLIEKNPLSKFALFNHDNKIEHYLDDAQLCKLMDVLRTDHNRAVCNIAILLLGTGCRLNEILTAKKSDIDVENRVLKIAAINAKGKRVRSVPLNDASLDIILKQFEDTKGFHTKGQDYLFINHKTKQPYTTIMKVWTRLRNKAGLSHLRIHDLRHSFASFLVNSGRTLYEVQQILGHSQSIVTERYAHLSSKTLQAAANSASIIIKGAMQSQLQQKQQLPQPIQHEQQQKMVHAEVVQALVQ
jgi:site-specific recombinase XerD